MRSSSVIFARSSRVLRSLGSWFSSGINEKVLTADERRWTQISCGGGAVSRRSTRTNDALSRQPMHWRFLIRVHLRPSAVKFRKQKRLGPVSARRLRPTRHVGTTAGKSSSVCGSKTSTAGRFDNLKVVEPARHYPSWTLFGLDGSYVL